MIDSIYHPPGAGMLRNKEDILKKKQTFYLKVT